MLLWAQSGMPPHKKQIGRFYMRISNDKKYKCIGNTLVHKLSKETDEEYFSV